jgi:dTDP-4-amino-4,6-dideoxygalactose transaminase
VKKRFGVKAKSLPQTSRAAGRVISLPLFPEMTENDVHYVCGVIKEILKNV